jgi:hypothetical protein
MTVEVVEARCPIGPQRLFAKFRLEGGVSPIVTDDNLIEFSCSDCKREYRRQGRSVERVLHRFNFFGDLVETAIEKPDRTS